MRFWRTCCTAGACLGAIFASVRGSDFEVINSSDSGYGSLRQAIFDANDNPGADRIVFNIPGAGAQFIQLKTSLPGIIEPVEIDGYSQPGASPNTLSNGFNGTLLIQIDGSLTAGTGLILAGGNSSVRGLVFNRHSIAIRFMSSSNVVAGNLIGPDPTGTNILGSTVGIQAGLDCCNVVGGVRPEDRNVIASAAGNAFQISGATDMVVQGNFLGTDATGLVQVPRNATFSTFSIHDTRNFLIGGLEPGAGNVIASGIWGLHLYPDCDALVLGNLINVGADGVTQFRNTNALYAIDAGGTARIERNTIANASYGIVVENRATILANRIFSNHHSGISFHGDVPANDIGDVDTGPNGYQNYPTFDAIRMGTNFLISGELSSRPNQAYHIEFFASMPRNTNGLLQGEVPLGSIEVTTSGAGDAPIEVEFPLPESRYYWVTATATDAEGNTSVFSTGAQIRSGSTLYIHQQPASATASNSTVVTFRAEISGAEPITYQWQQNGTNVPGATNSILTLTNVQGFHRGTYILTARNPFGSVTTEPAELVVFTGPVFVFQPVGQAVAPGEWVTVSVGLSEFTTPPIGYRWRSNGTFQPTIVSSNINSFFSYRAGTSSVSIAVAVTNLVARSAVLSTVVTISVAADRDEDGLPDAFESRFGLDPDSPADASSDQDLDGMNAGQEYLAGTDPSNRLSRLSLDRIAMAHGAASLLFTAMSNRTYRVEYRDDPGAGLWQMLQGVPARRTNGPVTIVDPALSPHRFYRVATPYQIPR